MDPLPQRVIEECYHYELAYRNFIRGVGEPPMVPRPTRWKEYLERKLLLDGPDRWDFQPVIQPPTYLPQHAYHLIAENTVSMPSQALSTIIRAIGNNQPQPIPTRPTYNTHNNITHHHPPPRRNYQNGYGRGSGYRGRGGFHACGRTIGNNWRGVRADRNATVPTPAPNTPIATNFGNTLSTFDGSDDVSLNASSIDLDFINGFANANINAADVASAENIQMMSGELEGEESTFNDTTGSAPAISGEGDIA